MIEILILHTFIFVTTLSVSLTIRNIFKKREETKQNKLDFEREKWLQAQAEKERDDSEVQDLKEKVENLQSEMSSVKVSMAWGQHD